MRAGVTESEAGGSISALCLSFCLCSPVSLLLFLTPSLCLNKKKRRKKKENPTLINNFYSGSGVGMQEGELCFCRVRLITVRSAEYRATSCQVNNAACFWAGRAGLLTLPISVYVKPSSQCVPYRGGRCPRVNSCSVKTLMNGCNMCTECHLPFSPHAAWTLPPPDVKRNQAKVTHTQICTGTIIADSNTLCSNHEP